MTGRPIPDPRAAYRHFLAIPTRWMDNDVYGHVNNVVSSCASAATWLAPRRTPS